MLSFFRGFVRWFREVYYLLLQASLSKWCQTSLYPNHLRINILNFTVVFIWHSKWVGLLQYENTTSTTELLAENSHTFFYQSHGSLKHQNFEFIMLHFPRTKMASGCFLLSDAKLVRTGNALITTEMILLSIFFWIWEAMLAEGKAQYSQFANLHSEMMLLFM